MTTLDTQASAGRRAQNRTRGQDLDHARVRARPIHPHSSYKVTRRCFERRLYFAPDDKAKELHDFIGYCLAYTANKYGIEVHAAVMMSNHYHIDVTDPYGQLPDWKQLFNSLLARGLNTLRGRFDSVWSGDGPCDTRRPNDDETFADLVYTLTNPVKAGIVKWARKWPGFTTVEWRFGETRSFRRPEKFFDDKGDMPEEVSLTLMRPNIFPELDDDELYGKLLSAVRDAELRAQSEMRAKGRRFLGPRKLEKQSWRRKPTSPEDRFKVTPTVAASSAWLRLAQLQRNRAWERAYATAREAWLEGKRDAVFPAGTYWLRRFAGVVVGLRPP